MGGGKAGKTGMGGIVESMKVGRVTVRIGPRACTLWLIKAGKQVAVEVVGEAVTRAWVVEDWASLARSLKEMWLQEMREWREEYIAKMKRAATALEELRELMRPGKPEVIVERADLIRRCEDYYFYKRRVSECEDEMRMLEFASEAIVSPEGEEEIRVRLE